MCVRGRNSSSKIVILLAIPPETAAQYGKNAGWRRGATGHLNQRNTEEVPCLFRMVLNSVTKYSIARLGSSKFLRQESIQPTRPARPRPLLVSSLLRMRSVEQLEGWILRGANLWDVGCEGVRFCPFRVATTSDMSKGFLPRCEARAQACRYPNPLGDGLSP